MTQEGDTGPSPRQATGGVLAVFQPELGLEQPLEVALAERDEAGDTISGRAHHLVSLGQHAQAATVDRLVTFGKRDFQRLLKTKFGLEDR